VATLAGLREFTVLELIFETWQQHDTLLPESDRETAWRGGAACQEPGAV